jgi:hypothetical protein
MSVSRYSKPNTAATGPCGELEQVARTKPAMRVSSTWVSEKVLVTQEALHLLGQGARAEDVERHTAREGGVAERGASGGLTAGQALQPGGLVGAVEPSSSKAAGAVAAVSDQFQLSLKSPSTVTRP